MTYATILQNRGVLRITGKDRGAFLQGLITNDVEKITTEKGIYAALLSPQGKFQYDLFILAWKDDKGEEAWLVDCDGTRAEALLKRLSLYKLRSEVTIENVSDRLSVYAVWGPKVLENLNLPQEVGAAHLIENGCAVVDPRFLDLGARIILPKERESEYFESKGIKLDAFEGYEYHRLKLGIPDIPDIVVDRGILLECGFDELNALDWNKGCYMGQELTARTRYRGLVRKRLIPVQIQGDAPPYQAVIVQDGVEVGEMRTSLKEYGIAMIRLEALSKPLPFHCGNATLTPHIPSWMALPSLQGENS